MTSVKDILEFTQVICRLRDELHDAEVREMTLREQRGRLFEELKALKMSASRLLACSHPCEEQSDALWSDLREAMNHAGSAPPYAADDEGAR